MAVLCLAVLSAAQAQPVDLLISEYVEGSSFNKAVEIYNGTGAPVDLSAYTLELYSNGSAAPSQSMTLGGVLADGDVYVLAHPSADAAILAVADATSGSVINFNGDDAVVLRAGAAVIDVIGQVGFDPGSQWGSGLASTADNTLRRLASACTGDSDASDAFDPALHYEGYDQNTFDGLGAHAATCSGGPGNTPPQFTSVLTDQTVAPGEAFGFTYTASDADPGDVLTFSLVDGPAGATLDPATGAFAWTPDAGQDGQAFTVSVSVSDGEAAATTSAVLTVASPSGHALAPGDLAVVGFNFDDPDELAFVALADVPAGTEITFTDNGWLAAGAFRTGEGTFTYTFPANLGAGTVVSLTGLGNIAFAAAGDQILIYQGTPDSPTFVYALNSEGSTWQADATNTNTSALPAGLTDGQTAVAIPEVDNAVYVGPTTGTRAALLAAISNPANWSGNDGARLTMPAGPFTLGSGPANTPPAFTATLPDTLLDAGVTLTFDFDATDADGDPITYALAAPGGSSIDAATGAFTWTTPSAPGIYAVSTTASDGTAAASATAYVGVRGTLFAGETGATLRQSLRSAYTPAQTLGYDVARDTMYARIDRGADGIVRGVYSGFGVLLPDGVDPSTYLFQNGINAEHTWPQSMGAETEPGRSDLHNLFPSKDNVNSARSNKPYAEIPDAQTQNWYRLDEVRTSIPPSDIDAYSESTSGYFEPREVHKGNAARAALYFYTIYETLSDDSFLLEQKDVFVDWNALDPANGPEIGRSARIALRQGNINPFLIDPTLAARAVTDVAPPPAVTIAEARAEAVGTLVTTEGVVTRAGGRFARIQDATAGLTVFQTAGAFRAAVEAGDVASGDRVRLTGTMDEFNGLRQIRPASFEVLERSVPLPAPAVVTLAEIAANGEAYESELIRVDGLVLDPAGDAVFQAARTYAVEDASAAPGTVDLRTPSSGEGAIIGTAIPPNPVTFVGVLGQFQATYQLQPIDASDVSADLNPDRDDDGFPNEDELACGSDPDDAGSVPYVQLPATATVTFHTTGVWGTGYNAEVRIRNDGATPIRGWTVTFEHAAQIVNLWNGQLASDGATRTVTDAGHNAVIAPGQTVKFGFQAKANAVETPAVFTFNAPPDCRVVPDVEISFVPKNVWGSGYNAELRLKNTGSVPVRGWKVTFEHVAPISSLWNGQLASDGATRTVTDAGYNAVIAPGQTVVVGYQVQSGTVEIPAEAGFAFGVVGPLPAGGAGKTGAEAVTDAADLPAAFALHGNYPNPFNPTTQIAFDLPEQTDVRLTVYDVLGRRVRVLVDGPVAAGRHTFAFDARDLPSGTYVYRLDAGSFTQTRMMLLVK